MDSKKLGYHGEDMYLGWGSQGMLTEFWWENLLEKRPLSRPKKI